MHGSKSDVLRAYANHLESISNRWSRNIVAVWSVSCDNFYVATWIVIFDYELNLSISRSVELSEASAHHCLLHANDARNPIRHQFQEPNALRNTLFKSVFEFDRWKKDDCFIKWHSYTEHYSYYETLPASFPLTDCKNTMCFISYYSACSSDTLFPYSRFS